MAGVTFTEQASQRIGKVVKKVEGQPDDRTGHPRFSYNGETEFLAIILGTDGSGRYTFNRVRPEPDKLHPDAVSPLDGDPMQFAFEGDAVLDAAREQNNNRSVPDRAIVAMRFTGYDPEGGATFVFFYPATPESDFIRPHDHRDIYNG